MNENTAALPATDELTGAVTGSRSSGGSPCGSTVPSDPADLREVDERHP